MTRFNTLVTVAAIVTAVLFATALPTAAAPFTSSYLDGTTEFPDTSRLLYGQGFTPFYNDGQSPGHAPGDMVSLSRFEFYKSFLEDEAENIKLAILDNYFINLVGLTTASPNILGMSTNTIASTAGLAVGDPIRFNFSDVDLTYAAYFAAVFVTDDGNGNLSPVLVSSMSAHWVEIPGSNPVAYQPETNYGDPSDFNLATSNFLNENEFGAFYAAFELGGDANFTAYFDYEFPQLLGDYNGDDVVDAADYTVWRNNLGPGSLPNEDETRSPGVVDGEDYLVWKENYGNSALGSGGGSLSGAIVPEPGTVALVLLAGGATVLGARGRRGRKAGAQRT